MFDSRRFARVVDALRLATISGTRFMSHNAPRIVPLSNKRRRAWFWPHQGSQEMARRRRQIEKGMLTVSNGLVLT